MKCPVCGTENEAGATFCYQCGGSLAAGATRSSTGPTVDLSRATREIFEREPEFKAMRAELRAAAAEPPEPSGGSRIYQVPAGSLPAYGGPSLGASSRTSSMAIVSLVLGIISFLGLFFIGGIGAIATGHLARREIRDSGGQISGGGLATAGLVLGYLNVLLTVVVVIGFCLLLSVGASLAP